MHFEHFFRLKKCKYKNLCTFNKSSHDIKVIMFLNRESMKENILN